MRGSSSTSRGIASTKDLRTCSSRWRGLPAPGLFVDCAPHKTSIGISLSPLISAGLFFLSQLSKHRKNSIRTAVAKLSLVSKLCRWRLLALHSLSLFYPFSAYYYLLCYPPLNLCLCPLSETLCSLVHCSQAEAQGCGWLNF